MGWGLGVGYEEEEEAVGWKGWQKICKIEELGSKGKKPNRKLAFLFCVLFMEKGWMSEVRKATALWRLLLTAGADSWY